MDNTWLILSLPQQLQQARHLLDKYDSPRNRATLQKLPQCGIFLNKAVLRGNRCEICWAKSKTISWVLFFCCFFFSFSLFPDLNPTTVVNFTLLQQSKQKAIMRRSTGPWLQLGFYSQRGKQSADVLRWYGGSWVCPGQKRGQAEREDRDLRQTAISSSSTQVYTQPVLGC